MSSGRGMLCGAGGDLKQSGMSESLPELLEEDVDIYYRFIVFGEFLKKCTGLKQLIFNLSWNQMPGLVWTSSLVVHINLFEFFVLLLVWLMFVGVHDDLFGFLL